jgi:hypothetical protein
MLVEDISSSQDLHHQAQKVALPELTILEGIGSDVIRAAEVQKEERRPEGDEMVILWCAAEEELAGSVCHGRVRQLVCQPEEESLYN